MAIFNSYVSLPVWTETNITFEDATLRAEKKYRSGKPARIEVQPATTGWSLQQSAVNPDWSTAPLKTTMRNHQRNGEWYPTPFLKRLVRHLLCYSNHNLVFQKTNKLCGDVSCACLYDPTTMTKVIQSRGAPAISVQGQKIADPQTQTGSEDASRLHREIRRFSPWWARAHWLKKRAKLPGLVNVYITMERSPMFNG